MPMHGQQVGEQQTRGRLATGQQVERLQAGTLLRVRFGSPLFVSGFGTFGDGWQRFVHSFSTLPL